MSETWTHLRFLLVYPLTIVFGLAWVGVFFVRWRHSKCIGDWWAMYLGGAMAAWASIGLMSLWLSRISGFNQLTSGIFTLGSLVPLLVMMACVISSFVRSWRS